MKSNTAVMKLILGALIFLFAAGGCSSRDSYFGVSNMAIIVPDEFRETEAVIKKAEESPGAKYCQEKIAQAKKLAKKGVDLYWEYQWVQRDQEAMEFLSQARKLAREAELCQPPKTKKPEPIKILYFAHNSDELSMKAKTILDGQAVILKEHPKNIIEVAGQAEAIGTPAYNRNLSGRRVRAVRVYLFSKGISPEQLKVVGFGELPAITSNITREGVINIGRIEFKIIKWKTK